MTFLVDAEGLAVEHDRGRRNPADEIDHAWQPGGDVVEAAAEQAHVVTVLVGLHSYPVELPFDTGQADLGKCIGDAGRGAGQHRLHCRERCETDVERLAGQRAARLRRPGCRATSPPDERRQSVGRWPWRRHRRRRLRWRPGATRRSALDTGGSVRPPLPPTTRPSSLASVRPVIRRHPSPRSVSVPRRRREIVSDDSAAGDTCRFDMVAQPTPSLPCRGQPINNPTAGSISSGAMARSKRGQRGHLLGAFRGRRGALRCCNELAVQHLATASLAEAEDLP